MALPSFINNEVAGARYEPVNKGGGGGSGPPSTSLPLHPPPNLPWVIMAAPLLAGVGKEGGRGRGRDHPDSLHTDSFPF